MPRALANRETVFETVKALVIQGVKTSEISQRCDVNPKTIRTWSRRYGWRAIASNVRQDVNEAVACTTSLGLKSVGERVRGSLANEIEAQVQLLEQRPAKCLKELQTSNGRTAVVRGIIESAATVFGWSKDAGTPFILNGSFTQIMQLQGAAQNAPIDA